MIIKTIDTGLFKLDGGAMFGVVPKSMWSKLNPPDQNNMCTWAMRCMLIVVGNRRILIDTGMGDKQDDKFKNHFYPHGEDTLLNSLKKNELSHLDITDVILTHLHFDHCGGAIYRNSDGILIPQFPYAKYWSHSDHWKWAINPNARERASFLSENILPIELAGKLHFLDKEDFGVKEFSFHYVYGHTEAMIIPIIDYKGKKILFGADLMPSSYHIPMPFVMGYDIRPMDTLKEREWLYHFALENNGVLFFEHDPIHCFGYLTKNDSGKVILADTTQNID